MAVAGVALMKSSTVQAADAASTTVGLVRGPELGMKPHSLRVGDAAGGWTWQPAEFRFLHAAYVSSLAPFGMVQMDNGEVALLGMVRDEKSSRETACAAFSSDGGSTWTDWHLVPDAFGRPMSLAYLGGGKLSFYGPGNKRFFSFDYGRTWPEQIMVSPAVEGEPLFEGGGWHGDGIHYASYRRGCCALVSRDNGLTWDLSREYRLHEFDFATSQEGIGVLACGRTCSTLLSDGSILTAYGHYISKGSALIRWRLPAAR